jgi:hypothetical protein
VTNGDLVGICSFFVVFEALVRATVSAYRLLVGLSPLPAYDSGDRMLKLANLAAAVKPTLEEVDSWMRSYEPKD